MAAKRKTVLEHRLIAKLVPYARNARTHSAEQVAQIAASIKEFGWTNPVLIDGADGIIAGHGRVMAAELLGMTEAPVIVLRHLTEQQKRAYILADNKLALNAGWDEDMLRLELLDLGQFDDLDLTITGFSLDEIADITESRSGQTDPEATPPPPAKPVSKLGDIWRLGDHRLMCGDCTNAEMVAALLDGAKPHLMVTDPPYGVEYDATWRDRAAANRMGKGRTGRVESDDKKDWREAWALFGGDVAYVWHAAHFAATVQESLEALNFEVRSQIIWNKTIMVLGRAHYQWKHEPCLYAVRKSATAHWCGDRKQTTVWDIASPLHIMSGSKEQKTAHPTQKPIECMKRPIENNSKTGDAVYEPFSGSGTTLIAAQMTGRRCFAMELSPAYCDVAVLRWQNFTGLTAELDADGSPFPASALTAAAAE